MTYLGILLAGVMLGAFALAIYKRRQRASWPSIWIHAGTPPAGADDALRILTALAPGPVRPGGVIEWTDVPFVSYGQVCDGIMISPLPVDVQVARKDGLVEHTALAHEIAHAWWRQLYGRDGEGEPEFTAWVARANRTIAAWLEGSR